MTAAVLELYALPMARWLVLVAVMLEAYRVLLVGVRSWRRGADVRATLHEMRAGVALVGIIIFYVNALLVGDPLSEPSRWGIVTVNCLYALYFFSVTAGHYTHLERRARRLHLESKGLAARMDHSPGLSSRAGDDSA